MGAPGPDHIHFETPGMACELESGRMPAARLGSNPKESRVTIDGVSFEQEMSSSNWISLASRLPLAFAQVREDPLIDLSIIAKLAPGARGIMVASGGCTAALLSGQNKFVHLTLVDMNPAQLGLTAIKLELLKHFTPDDRLSILGHKFMPVKTRRKILRQLLAETSAAENTLGPLDLVAELGPDYAGRYELLFRRLQYEIGASEQTQRMLALDKTEHQQKFFNASPEYFERLKNAFNSVLSLPNLVQLFGETATRNAAMPFADHFYNRTVHAFQTLPAASNPYLSQVLSGQFRSNSSYAWLELPAIEFATEITYAPVSMLHALTKSRETFDFIHLSNILDWLSEDEALALLKVAASKLNKDGWIIVRQLNSTLQIPELGKSLSWHKDLAKTLHATDRSYFYRELHLAQHPAQ
jgi:S-adenosylmethionine-diacylglycerol 3-amino-3-carboxypropyl transferase